MRAAPLLLVCTAGCAHFAGFGFPAPHPIAAPNPLEGRPLYAEVGAGSPDLQVAKGENCSFWPITDEYTVEASESQLCVAVVFYVLSYESGPYPVEYLEVGVSTDGRKPTFFRLGARDRMRKVGQCYVSDPKMTGVWKVEVAGCRPNELITRATKTVTIRRKRGLIGGDDGLEVATWQLINLGAPASAPVAAVPPPKTLARPPPAPAKTSAAPSPLTGLTPPPLPPTTPPASPSTTSATPPAPPTPPAVPVRAVSAGKLAVPAPSPAHREATALYEQSLPLLGLQRYADAVAAFTHCVQLDAAFAEAYVARGNALMGLRRHLEAVADYQYAATLKPAAAAPLYGLAEAYNRLGRTPEARTYYQRYLDSHAPDAAPVLKDDARTKLSQLR